MSETFCKRKLELESRITDEVGLGEEFEVSDVFVDDVVDVILNTGCDVSNATVWKIRYEKPSGGKGEWSATLDDDPTKIRCSNVVFDEVGQWKIQACVETPTAKNYGRIVHLLVKTHL